MPALKVNLRRERLDRGLSRNAAAREIGVHKEVLKGAEDGTSMPFPEKAYAIATFFGHKVSEVWDLEADEVAA
jgi:DNA-binding XRE family transcriptional regulator